MFELSTIDRDATIAAMAALSVFSAVLVASWPFLARDVLAIRMRKVATERDRLRERERARLNGPKTPRLVHKEAGRLYREVVERLNLIQLASDGETGRMLRMAGYRGHGALTTFVAFRVFMPLAMFVSALVYAKFIVFAAQPFVIQLGVGVFAGAAGYYLPAIFLKNRITKRQQSIQRAWPDALDLLLICVESGMAVEGAFRKVAEDIGAQSVELAEELSVTTAELSYLQDRQKAYENLAERTGVVPVKAVVASLKQADKHGTSLGQSLRVMAQESRDYRMSEAEKKAAALPPMLTVPMILFFLPVLFAVIITPAAIQVMAL